MEHINAVILGGGSGTRLWPLSKPTFPKQFLSLPNGSSMIQESQSRVASLVAPEHFWVVTGRNIAGLVHEHLPAVPESHILGGRGGRNNYAAIARFAPTIAREDPPHTTIVLQTDNVIRKVPDLH